MSLNKRHRKHSALIVDTSDLIDPTPVFQQFWSPDQPDDVCKNTARYASEGSDTIIARAIQKAQSDNELHALNKPVASIVDKNITTTVWHSGSLYQMYAYGNIESIFDICDLTENERESYTHKHRMMVAQGHSVFALASGTQPTRPRSFLDIRSGDRLHFDGFLVVTYHLRPYIHRCIMLAQQQQLPIIYISGDDPVMVTALARQAEIINPVAHATDCSGEIGQTPNTAYANVDTSSRNKLLDRHSPHTIVNGVDLRDYVTG